MKKIYCLLSVLLISTFSFAQHCDVPMPPNIFKQQLKAIATQPDDAQRLRYAKSLFPSDCMLSSQAKEMAMVFTKDYYRLEFVKLAWPNIFDSDNFYDLYDVFSSLSSAIRLYDYVNKGQNNYVPPPSPAPGSNWYPDISYPSPDTYKGMTGCKLPIADHDFEVLSRPARNQKTDDMRRGEAIKLVTGNCLSMSQAMKLGSLLEMESMRLTFMKEVFPQLFDL